MQLLIFNAKILNIKYFFMTQNCCKIPFSKTCFAVFCRYGVLETHKKTRQNNFQRVFK